MTLNGKELNYTFNALDADDLERFEKGQQHIAERDAQLSKDRRKLTQSEVIRYQCHSIFEFFNIVLGEGADKAIFGEKTALDVCWQTLNEFINSVANASTAVMETASKYAASRLDRG